MDYHGSKPLLVILVYGGLAILGILMVYLNSIGNTHQPTLALTFSMHNSLNTTPRQLTKLKYCEDLLNNTHTSMKSGTTLLQSLTSLDHITTPDILELTRHCNSYLKNRKYFLDPTSPEEVAYPIAYTITVNKDAEEFERTLMSLYQPQNLYCVRLGEAQDSATEFVINRIALCFHNVFLIGETPQYGRLESEFGCSRHLLMDYNNWKYHINVDDAMFPVKTNWEVVQIVKALNGSGIIHVRRPRRTLEKGADHRLNAFLRDRNKLSTVLLTVLSRDCLTQVTDGTGALQFLTLLKQDQDSDTYFVLVSPRNNRTHQDEPSAALIPGYWLSMSGNRSGLIEHIPPTGSITVHDVCPNMTSLFDKHVLFLSLFSLENYQQLYTCLRCFLLKRTQDYVEGKRTLNVMYYHNLKRIRT